MGYLPFCGPILGTRSLGTTMVTLYAVGACSLMGDGDGLVVNVALETTFFVSAAA